MLPFPQWLGSFLINYSKFQMKTLGCNLNSRKVKFLSRKRSITLSKIFQGYLSSCYWFPCVREHVFQALIILRNGHHWKSQQTPKPTHTPDANDHVNGNGLIFFGQKNRANSNLHNLGFPCIKMKVNFTADFHYLRVQSRTNCNFPL